MKPDNNTLQKVWNEAILGRMLYQTNNLKTNRDLIQFFDATLSEELEALIETLKIDPGISKYDTDEEYVEAIVDKLKSYPFTTYGFYPKAIRKEEGVTCAGATLFASHLLRKANIQHQYARPVGHSVLIVYINDKNIWMDSINGVVDEVRITEVESKTFKEAHIQSDNERIEYELALLLPSNHIFTAIFGNMEQLKFEAKTGNKQASELVMEDLDLLSKVDFNEINFALFPDRFEFLNSQHYLEEKARIKNLNEANI